MLTRVVLYIISLIFVSGYEKRSNPFEMLPNMKHKLIGKELSTKTSPEFKCEEQMILLYYKRMISVFLNHLKQNENKSYTGKFLLNIKSDDYLYLRNFINNYNQIDTVTLSNVDNLVILSLQEGYFHTISDDLRQLILDFVYILLYIIIIILLYYYFISKFSRLKWKFYIAIFAIINFLWYAYITYINKMLEKHQLLDDYHDKCNNQSFTFWSFWSKDKCNKIKLKIMKDVIHELFLPKLLLQCILDLLAQCFSCLGFVFSTFVINFTADLTYIEMFIYTPIFSIFMLLIIFYVLSLILMTMNRINQISFLGLNLKKDTSTEQFRELENHMKFVRKHLNKFDNINNRQLLTSDNKDSKLIKDLEVLLNIESYKTNSIETNINDENEVFYDASNKCFN